MSGLLTDGKWCGYCRKTDHDDTECHSTRPVPFHAHPQFCGCVSCIAIDKVRLEPPAWPACNPILERAIRLALDPNAESAR